MCTYVLVVRLLLRGKFRKFYLLFFLLLLCSIFDFLELLKLASPQGSSSEEPEADSPQVLTVRHFAPS